MKGLFLDAKLIWDLLMISSYNVFCSIKFLEMSIANRHNEFNWNWTKLFLTFFFFFFNQKRLIFFLKKGKNNQIKIKKIQNMNNIVHYLLS